MGTRAVDVGGPFGPGEDPGAIDGGTIAPTGVHRYVQRVLPA